MTTLQERPAQTPRLDVIALERSALELGAPRLAPTLRLSELMGRRPDLREVYTPATIATDAVLWSA